MTPDDARALEQFAASKGARARIREYLNDSDGSVPPDSDLGQDDRLWRHHPTSQVAWTAMVAASEHLDLVEAILDMAPARTYATAPFSVVRGALVGAAQSVWVLAAPTPVHRQQRSLSIAIEYLTQRIGYQVEQLKLCSEEQKAASQAQIDDVLAPLLVEAHRRRLKGYRFTDTGVIAAAAEHCFPENSANVAVTVDLHWRRLGGDAHSLGWQLLLGNASWSGGDPTELGRVVVTGNVADVVDSSAWAFQFLSRAVGHHKRLSASGS